MTLVPRSFALLRVLEQGPATSMARPVSVTREEEVSPTCTGQGGGKAGWWDLLEQGTVLPEEGEQGVRTSSADNGNAESGGDGHLRTTTQTRKGEWLTSCSTSPISGVKADTLTRFSR